jgi:hypothetical protein
MARWARCTVSDECRVDLDSPSMVAWHESHHPDATLVPNRRLFEEERERTGGRLFKHIGDYLRDIPREVPWLWRPMAYFGGVSMLAGIWKGGKSELAAGLIRARLDGVPFLGQDLPPGPTYLITEEGGISMAEKYDGYDGFEVVDRRDMEFEGQTLDDVLESIRDEATDAHALVVIDTFVVMSEVEEENSSTEITKAIRKVMNFAQATRAAVLIIDHTGKQTSGLNHGRSIRGSGAKPATLDIYGVLDYGPTATQRILATEGRVKDAREKLRIDFDPGARAYTLLVGDSDETKWDRLTAGIPVSGDGWSESKLASFWRVSRPTVTKQVDELVRAGRMRREWGKVGNADAWLHWAVLPVIDHPEEAEDEG